MKNPNYKAKGRRESASSLQAERKLRSNEQQTVLLNERLGDGVGAIKERAKLAEKTVKS